VPMLSPTRGTGKSPILGLGKGDTMETREHGLSAEWSEALREFVEAGLIMRSEGNGIVWELRELESATTGKE